MFGASLLRFCRLIRLVRVVMPKLHSGSFAGVSEVWV